MPNPKTGKPQLSDYEYKGPPRKRKPVDIFGEDIDALPDNPTGEIENASDERTSLDGKLRFKP